MYSLCVSTVYSWPNFTVLYSPASPLQFSYCYLHPSRPCLLAVTFCLPLERLYQCSSHGCARTCYLWQTQGQRSLLACTGEASYTCSEVHNYEDQGYKHYHYHSHKDFLPLGARPTLLPWFPLFICIDKRPITARRLAVTHYFYAEIMWTDSNYRSSGIRNLWPLWDQ